MVALGRTLEAEEVGPGGGGGGATRAAAINLLRRNLSLPPLQNVAMLQAIKRGHAFKNVAMPLCITTQTPHI